MFTKKVVKQNRIKHSWSCPEKDCSWQGDRLINHLKRNHDHDNDSARAAFLLVKQKSPQTPVTSKYYKVKGMSTSDTVSTHFCEWINTFAGGFKIPDNLEEHDRKKKERNNKASAQKI